MHSCMCVSRSFRLSVSFFLRFAKVAILRVGRWCGFSSCKFYPPTGTAGSCPGLFILKICVFWHLGCLLSLSSQPYIIWTHWGLHSVLDLRASCLGGFQGSNAFEHIIIHQPRCFLWVSFSDPDSSLRFLRGFTCSWGRLLFLKGIRNFLRI